MLFDGQTNQIFNKVDRDFLALILIFKMFVYEDILTMLKYLQSQLSRCEENIRQQLFEENCQGKLCFQQLFASIFFR